MRKIIYILMLSSLMACSTESFEDINRNIDELSGEDVNTLYLINNGIRAINSFQGTSLVTFMEWAHHTSWLNTPQGEYEHFNEEGIWHLVYSTNKNLVDALERTEQLENSSDGDAHAMALILRSYMFLRLTDSYGDVPYFEAGYEDENGIIETPAYDKQRDIYVDIFANLTKAIELIADHGSINFGPADFIYGGDLQAWKKFANSLRLRMALRINSVEESLSNQWFAEVAKYPVIDSDNESASYARFDQSGYRNPYYDQLVSGTRVHSSAVVVDQLQDTNDPRLPLYAKPINNDPSGTTYVGLPNGQSGAGILFDDYSFIGPIVYQADRPTPIFLYSEICFIRAERYLLGIGGETIDLTKANTWYQNGIRSAMEFMEVDELDVVAFLATGEATLSGDEENMKRLIGTQKWLSFYSNGGEAHAEIKRSGYPVIPVRTIDDGPLISMGETNGYMPRRVKYPDSEMLLNGDNYQKAFEATDGNSFLHRMWWDVN
jgi:frataxin-like iron-binding protein CyaY